MFQGIIEEVGEVRGIEVKGFGKEYAIYCEGLGGLELGESMGVNGVCESIIGVEGWSFKVYASSETLSLTNLEDLRVGDWVNLERPMRMGMGISGHLVQGHIDGFGWVKEKKKEGLDHRVWIRCGGSLLKYIVKKGSIAVDGVSLTVNGVMDFGFEVMIIPITYSRTIMKDYGEGSKVNIEVDIMGKYVERLIQVYCNENF